MGSQYLLPFPKGLNTDQGLIGGDSGYTRDESNIPLQIDGTRMVRLGLDYESTANLLGLGGTVLNTTAFIAYTWSKAGNKDKVFIVLQQGYKLHFFDANNADLMAGFTTTLELTPTPYYSLDAASDCRVQFASGNGSLFIAGSKFEPCRVNYDGTSITITTITIQVRDYFGLDDGVPSDLRPKELVNDNKYNLFNVGWYQKVVNRYGETVQVVDEFYTQETDFPAKGYQWWRGKRASKDGKFYSEDIRNNYTGAIKAPQGHFIIDVFKRNYSRASICNNEDKPEYFANSVNGPATFNYTSKDEERNRPACVAWYAGRIFWAGVESLIDGKLSTSPDITGHLFYSQTIKSNTEYGYCYQASDPTSENDSDVVATDGGYMPLPGIGLIQCMYVVGESLVLLTDKEIWAVRGGDAGFTAEDQQSYKILDSGVAGPACVVMAEGNLFVWANDGIYSLGPDDRTGLVKPENISAGRVRALVTSVTPVQQKYMQSVYDSLNKKVSWWYNAASDFNGSADISKLTAEVTYDLLLGSFCKNLLATNTAYTATAPYYTITPRIAPTYDVVTSLGDDVTSSGETVTISGTSYTYTANKVFMFLLNVNSGNIGVAYYKNTNYKDYNTTYYTAYIQGSHDPLGDPTSKKYPIYLRCQFKRTETAFVDDGLGNPTLDYPSSCKFQGRWDYSDSATSGKWSSDQELYRLSRPYMPTSIGSSFDYGQEIITTKTKIMGTGKALAMRFSSAEGKGFHLLGVGFEGVVTK